MSTTSRRKTEKSGLHSMRPSLFLNELDIQSLMMPNSIKTESSEPINKKKPEEITYKLNVIPESQSFVMLPSIGEKFMVKQKEQHKSMENIERKRSSKLIQFESVLPSMRSEIKLPQISQQQQEKRHSRRFTSDDLADIKKVVFRPSILVIDFINDIIKKDSLDGSVKPLTKKLQRQQTKFVKQIK